MVSNPPTSTIDISLTSSQAAPEDDTYRHERDSSSFAPPPSYHTRAGFQVSASSNYGRPPSAWQNEARARSQYNSYRSHVSEGGGRPPSDSTIKQRHGSAMFADQDKWDTSTQVTKTSIKDRVGNFLGKNKEMATSAKQGSSQSRKPTSSSPGSPSWGSDYQCRRRRFSGVDDRLNRGMPHLYPLREEDLAGSVIDLEPGEVRRLMLPSASTEEWVNLVPLTEQAVATLNSRPQLGRMRAQSEIPLSNRRMISQERAPQSIAPGESAFSTVEPYDRTSTRPEPNRAKSAAPRLCTTPSPPHSQAPSYRTVDPQNIHGAKGKTPEEDDDLSVAIQNSLREVGPSQPLSDSTIVNHDGPSAMQLRMEEDELAAAIQESIKDIAIATRGDSKAIEKRISQSDAQKWDKDGIATAGRQSTRDTKISQRSDDRAFGETSSYLAGQRREQELAAYREQEAGDTVRRLRELNDVSRQEREAQDAARRRREAEDADRRKREADEAARQHHDRMRELEYESERRRLEIALSEQQAEHAARMRDLELDARERQLAGIAEARGAESARKIRHEGIAAQKHIAEEKKRLADERSQLEYDRRKADNEMAEKQWKEGLVSRCLVEETAARRHDHGRAERPHTSMLNDDGTPPPYSSGRREGITTDANDRGHYCQPSQPTSTVMQPVSATPQVVCMPPATIPQPIIVQSHLTVTQPMSLPHPAPNGANTQQPVNHTTRNSSSSAEIYRPPRRVGNIMPESITRIQQHYRFRRSLIERNVQEGRRTSEQGRAAIACLTRNEVADVDSEPRRMQELNVIGLEAFEADIELLDTMGGDQMAPPVPWAIPSLETECRGNYNHADLRQHIESLLAQQDANVITSSRIGFVRLGSAITHRDGSRPGASPPAGGFRYYERQEEYRF
jgi:hypothetical protein